MPRRGDSDIPSAPFLTDQGDSHQYISPSDLILVPPIPNAAESSEPATTLVPNSIHHDQGSLTQIFQHGEGEWSSAPLSQENIPDPSLSIPGPAVPESVTACTLIGVSPTVQNYSGDHEAGPIAIAPPDNIIEPGNEIPWSFENITLPPDDGPPGDYLPAKVGARFSRSSSMYLKRWLANHEGYPYPSKEDVKMIQHQTGLSKTQIKNWMANTRRRIKNFGSSQSVSPYVYSQSSVAQATGIPRRTGTPAIPCASRQDDMTPLERWRNSPPEDEPVSIFEIANAVDSAASAPAQNDGHHLVFTDDDSGQSFATSSISSHRTSNGSSSDAFSHASGEGSYSPFPKAQRKHRHRRNRMRKNPISGSLAVVIQRKYQCTFCAETFKRKYDWKRHEMSLHISLEQWTCAPFGPRTIDPHTGDTCCVFCGEPNPSDDHIELHAPSACENRKFSRKDHVRQHLRLVHDSELIDWATQNWMTSCDKIKSRCGFCQVELSSWTERVEHLSDHFTLGSTLADWSGDWGFDEEVIQTLENSIPPYLIHWERNSPFPFQANGVSPESPRTAYELLVMELSYFKEKYQAQHKEAPSSEGMQLEACRIILAAEVLLGNYLGVHASWLRDVITADEAILERARLEPARTAAEGRLRSLEIRGKASIFDGCPLESRLYEFVQDWLDTGSSQILDSQLRKKACEIIVQLSGGTLPSPIDDVSRWLLRLICGSSGWLGKFRSRYGLPPSQVEDLTKDNSHVINLCHSIHSDTQTETSLLHNCMGTLEHEVRSVPPWSSGGGLQRDTGAEEVNWPDEYANNEQETGDPGRDEYQRPAWLGSGNYILNDPSFHQWLGRELVQWVMRSRKRLEADSYVPSDDEIRRQARLLLYDDDDSWNQTAVDHPEWLARFKDNLDASIDNY